MTDTEPAVSHLYHTRHTCGHAVWWDAPIMAALAQHFPCPWCGGESGQPFSNAEAIIALRFPDGREVTCYPDLTSSTNHDDLGMKNIGHHRPDESCCRP